MWKGKKVVYYTSADPAERTNAVRRRRGQEEGATYRQTENRDSGTKGKEGSNERASERNGGGGGVASVRILTGSSRAGDPHPRLPGLEEVSALSLPSRPHGFSSAETGRLKTRWRHSLSLDVSRFL
eukprot:108705-Hanusia_phi.AAC.1